MPTGSQTKVIGACTGLCGFVIAIIAGMSAGNPTDVILSRTIMAMICTFCTGLAVGALAEHAFGAGLNALRAAAPLETAGQGSTPGSSTSSFNATTGPAGDGRSRAA